MEEGPATSGVLLERLGRHGESVGQALRQARETRGACAQQDLSLRGALLEVRDDGIALYRASER